MARVIRQDAEAVGSDSFLDVVTNIVGILIILVMVVGIRVKNTPKEAAVVDHEAAKTRVAQLQGEADALESDVLKLENQIGGVALRRRPASRSARHARLSGQRGPDRTRSSKTDSRCRGTSRVKARAPWPRPKLKCSGCRLPEATPALPKKKKPIQIKSYPTPLSHTVVGAEIHFQLRHGRLAWACWNWANTVRMP